MNDHTQKDRIEIWGDIVQLTDLVKSIAITVLTTMSAYFFAPKENLSLQLFFGLGGAVLGFFICTFLVEPKRHVTVALPSKDPLQSKENRS